MVVRPRVESNRANDSIVAQSLHKTHNLIIGS